MSKNKNTNELAKYEQNKPDKDKTHHPVTHIIGGGGRTAIVAGGVGHHHELPSRVRYGTSNCGS